MGEALGRAAAERDADLDRLGRGHRHGRRRRGGAHGITAATGQQAEQGNGQRQAGTAQ